ncbi:hypothetical protein L596_013813 [Steinernema carpocapsae]|uniref:Uncharacterized protein n=1 Tax=Steinernema carpocapsae TaxID=34508 RepID=A0A4U5P1V6_STECR|nr:hypothetical protein L596_013813 [Steinernema carpocapsae]
MKASILLLLVFVIYGTMGSENDMCDPPCNEGSTCVYAPKQCFTTPCTQYECVDTVTASEGSAEIEAN